MAIQCWVKPVFRVPAKRVIPVILKIIELFKQNKKSDDNLQSWIHRVVNNNEDSADKIN